MNIYVKNDLAVLAIVGKKIKEIRLEQNLTQKELQSLSGVSRNTIIEIEQGRNTSMLTMIQLLRGLNRFDLLEPFFTKRQISPIEYAKFQGKNLLRERASSTKTSDKIDTNDISQW